MTKRLRYGTGIGGRETMLDVGHFAAEAERAGFEQLTILDDLVLTRDVFCMLAVAATATSKIMVGTGVTHPYVRHPTQTVTGIASINELSRGRAFLGMGAGALYPVLGMKNGSYADVREMLTIARELPRGKTVLGNGVTVESPWIEDPFPIYLGADGPRTMRLAGELADATWIMGLHPELTKWRMETIAEGAEAAGRNREDLDIWLRCNVVLADSKEEGREVARIQAATHAHQFVRAILNSSSPDAHKIRSRLPQSMLDDYARVADAWSYHEHDSLEASHAKAVSDQLVDTYAIVGTPEDCAEAIASARDWGFDGISVTTSTQPDKVKFWHDFQAHVASLV